MPSTMGEALSTCFREGGLSVVHLQERRLIGFHVSNLSLDVEPPAGLEDAPER